MYSDREEDILYLAHQLWEELDEPETMPQTFWKRAALQVLARGHRPGHKAEATGKRRHGSMQTRRPEGHVQSAATVRIRMGTAVKNRSVTLIRRSDHSAVANPARRPVRLAD